MRCTSLLAMMLASVSSVAVLFLSPARAEGDAPYLSNNQTFDNNYQLYKRDRGYSTNFATELLPVRPFGDDGRLKFESRDVTRPGASATRFDDSKTGLQLDFNF